MLELREAGWWFIVLDDLSTRSARRGASLRSPHRGDDYPTADGTCLRDFIHFSDLADAHVRAVEHLLARGSSRILNCGYGHGYSMRAVLDAVGRVSGRPLAIARASRRPGDAVEVVAATERIRRELGWQPRYDDLEEIVRHALAFERHMREHPPSGHEVN